MIESLRNWTTTLARIAIFGSICEVVLPGGVFEKYVRLCIGFVLILALVSPIYDLISIGLGSELEFNENLSAYESTGEMEERQRTEVMRVYKENLNTKIRDRLSRELSGIVFEVECDVEEEKEKFGTIKRIDVLIDSVQMPEIGEKLRTVIKEEFGVETVLVKFLKENSG